MDMALTARGELLKTITTKPMMLKLGGFRRPTPLSPKTEQTAGTDTTVETMTKESVDENADAPTETDESGAGGRSLTCVDLINKPGTGTATVQDKTAGRSPATSPPSKVKRASEGGRVQTYMRPWEVGAQSVSQSDTGKLDDQSVSQSVKSDSTAKSPRGILIALKHCRTESVRGGQTPVDGALHF